MYQGSTTEMNLNLLEKVARQVAKGGGNDSSDLLNRGFITPIEHKSLSSLSWQIAANIRANGDGTVAYSSKVRPDMGGWF
jgi:hypothetical protein